MSDLRITDSMRKRARAAAAAEIGRQCSNAGRDLRAVAIGASEVADAALHAAFAFLAPVDGVVIRICVGVDPDGDVSAHPVFDGDDAAAALAVHGELAAASISYVNAVGARPRGACERQRNGGERGMNAAEQLAGLEIHREREMLQRHIDAVQAIRNQHASCSSIGAAAYTLWVELCEREEKLQEYPR